MLEMQISRRLINVAKQIYARRMKRLENGYQLYANIYLGIYIV